MGQVLPTSMPTQMPTPPQKSPEPVSISTPLFESYNEIYRSKPIDIPKKNLEFLNNLYQYTNIVLIINQVLFYHFFNNCTNYFYTYCIT